MIRFAVVWMLSAGVVSMAFAQAAGRAAPAEAAKPIMPAPEVLPPAGETNCPGWPFDPAEAGRRQQAVTMAKQALQARWSHLKGNAKQPTIDKVVDDAVLGIERDNPSLKGVLPKGYTQPALTQPASNVYG